MIQKCVVLRSSKIPGWTGWNCMCHAAGLRVGGLTCPLCCTALSSAQLESHYQAELDCLTEMGNKLNSTTSPGLPDQAVATRWEVR